MSCSGDIRDYGYDFFDNISNYMKDGKSIEDTVKSVDASKHCDSFSSATASQLGDKENAKYICEIFTKLYKYLPNLKNEQKQHQDYKKDCALLNYWLNFKLNYGIINGRACVSELNNYFGSHCNDLIVFDSNCLDYLYDIKQDELNKMYILYSLYEKYSKLNAVIESKLVLDKESFLSLSIECCSDYNYASYLCNDSNQNKNRIFCKKLQNFGTKYEELHGKVGEKKSDFSDSLIKLSECPNNKIITTSVIGSVVGLIPLLGVLYKFTPMGQVLRTKMGILNNDISNNDEEMTNISLIEQENESLKFQKGTYNIKYQTL